MALYHSARGSVDYTIVGSPTIVDGVASGFSGSSYVQSSSTFPGSTSTSLEFATKFNISSLASTSTIASSTSSTIPFHLAVRDSKFRLYPGIESTYKVGDFVLSANTDYWIKLFWDSTTGWKLQYSTNGINYTTDFENYNPSNSAPKDNYIVLGRNYPNGGQEGLLGTLDLNHTYITANGQPWFGICPIEVKKVSLNNNTVKYIIKDGKLIWADPNLYLLNSGRAYINTGVPSNAVTNYKIDYRITDSSIRIMAFGADVSFRNKSDTFIGIGNSGLYWYYGTGDSAYHVLLSKSSEYYLQKNRLEVNYSSTSATASIYNNIEQISSYTTTASELSSNTYYLFGLNRNGTATLDGSLRIYSAQYYGSNINKHLVPVPQGLQIGSFTVPSNGMFDIINQQFYGNQGAGQFTIGRDE